ncbi:MAG: hypothetical protein Q7I97_09895 [Thermovirgaceae bacterium]|nr:hypothetical protein [Thermovirgaceae bacterium]
MAISIFEALEGWDSKDLGNLCSILRINSSSSLELIEDKIKWLYFSKTRAALETTTRNVGSKILGKISKSITPESLRIDDIREAPSYDSLVYKACESLKASENGASLSDHETFLSHAVIILALERMKPHERREFFEKEVEVPEFIGKARINNDSLAGPATTLAILGLAQASGFGVFMASTTALGFVTHAIGVTLPFAVYTGMTSTIAFLIGPVGWLSAGFLGAWKLTQPSWKTLIPALILIIATNSRKKLEESN